MTVISMKEWRLRTQSPQEIEKKLALFEHARRVIKSQYIREDLDCLINVAKEELSRRAVQCVA